MKNIVLIGMPSAGKSTVGVVLAKTLGMCFIDTDLIIQEKTGRLLQAIINQDGIENFLKIEEAVMLSVDVKNTVIATGGSVVFCKNAIEHLKVEGLVVYLKVSFAFVFVIVFKFIPEIIGSHTKQQEAPQT